MKGRSQALVFGLAVAGALRFGLAFWRGSARVEAVMITMTTFALLFGYLILSRDGRKT